MYIQRYKGIKENNELKKKPGNLRREVENMKQMKHENMKKKQMKILKLKILKLKILERQRLSS